MDTWQRPPSPSNDPTLSPEELEEVRSKIQIPRLTEAEAPSLASQQFESANENSKSTDNNVDHLNQSASSNTPAGESSIPPLTSLKRVSSFGSRTIAIIGILSLMTAFGLGVVLFSKSEWNLQAWRSANESLTASFPNLVSARDAATPSSTLPAPIDSAPESNPSETTTQLQSFGKELGSGRI